MSKIISKLFYALGVVAAGTCVYSFFQENIPMSVFSGLLAPTLLIVSATPCPFVSRD